MSVVLPVMILVIHGPRFVVMVIGLCVLMVSADLLLQNEKEFNLLTLHVLHLISWELCVDDDGYDNQDFVFGWCQECSSSSSQWSRRIMGPLKDLAREAIKLLQLYSQSRFFLAIFLGAGCDLQLPGQPVYWQAIWHSRDLFWVLTAMARIAIVTMTTWLSPLDRFLPFPWMDFYHFHESALVFPSKTSSKGPLCSLTGNIYSHWDLSNPCSFISTSSRSSWWGSLCKCFWKGLSISGDSLSPQKFSHQ